MVCVAIIGAAQFGRALQERGVTTTQILLVTRLSRGDGATQTGLSGSARILASMIVDAMPEADRGSPWAPEWHRRPPVDPHPLLHVELANRPSCRVVLRDEQGEVLCDKQGVPAGDAPSLPKLAHELVPSPPDSGWWRTGPAAAQVRAQCVRVVGELLSMLVVVARPILSCGGVSAEVFTRTATPADLASVGLSAGDFDAPHVSLTSDPGRGLRAQLARETGDGFGAERATRWLHVAACRLDRLKNDALANPFDDGRLVQVNSLIAAIDAVARRLIGSPTGVQGVGALVARSLREWALAEAVCEALADQSRPASLDLRLCNIAHTLDRFARFCDSVAVDRVPGPGEDASVEDRWIDRAARLGGLLIFQACVKAASSERTLSERTLGDVKLNDVIRHCLAVQERDRLCRSDPWRTVRDNETKIFRKKASAERKWLRQLCQQAGVSLPSKGEKDPITIPADLVLIVAKAAEEHCPRRGWRDAFLHLASGGERLKMPGEGQSHRPQKPHSARVPPAPEPEPKRRPVRAQQ